MAAVGRIQAEAEGPAAAEGAAVAAGPRRGKGRKAWLLRWPC